jgi:4-hydroxy-4-methyl-2-oxoglutarate aldolase
VKALSLYQQLARLGSATVYEAAGQQGLVDIPLHQVVAGSRVAGPARRCSAARATT